MDELSALSTSIGVSPSSTVVTIVRDTVDGKTGTAGDIEAGTSVATPTPSLLGVSGDNDGNTIDIGVGNDFGVFVSNRSSSVTKSSSSFV